MTALVDNAAVIAPRKTLTARQRALLATIDRLEGRRVKNAWAFGDERYSYTLVEALKGRGLVDERSTGFSKRLRLTYAGHIALARLNATTKGNHA